MNAANIIVGLILSLQTPFFIAALIAGIWANSRIRSGNLGGKTRLLAWTSFISCVLVTVSYVGRAVLIVRFGAGDGVLMTLFMAGLWAFFSANSYALLRKIGAA